MAVVGTALQTDIAWVIKSYNDSNYTWDVELHCGTQRNVTPIKLTNIDILRDFEGSYADEISLEAIFIQQDYDLYVFPNRDQLLVTLTKRPIGPVSDAVQVGKQGYAKTFRGTLSSPTSNVLNNGTGYTAPTDNYSTQALTRIRIQLIDRAIEQLRLTTVGNIYRKCTPATALLTELTARSVGLNLDMSDKPKGVDMVPADNTTLRNQIVLPHGLPLVNMAHHIQETDGGIYKTGMGCYYHNNYWYVYPPFDVTRFPKAKKTLTVLIIRSMELPAADNTYRVDGDTVTIVANGKTSHFDPVDHQAANIGNGVRFAKATELLSDFVSTGNGQVVANADKIMGGFMGQQRDSKMENLPFSENRITDNVYHESSRVAARQGQRIQLNWDRADNSLITPGMPCRVLYENNGVLFELMGCVLNMQSQVRMDVPGLTSTRYITGVGMTLFVAVTKTSQV